jgi:hypothetical protein
MMEELQWPCLGGSLPFISPLRSVHSPPRESLTTRPPCTALLDLKRPRSLDGARTSCAIHDSGIGVSVSDKSFASVCILAIGGALSSIFLSVDEVKNRFDCSKTVKSQAPLDHDR